MSKPGPKPKPTHLKLVTGNPGRRQMNKAEPKPPKRQLTPPPSLLPDARAEWDRVAGDLVRAGLITVADAAALAVYCTAYGRWVQAERVLAKAAENDPVFEGLLIKTPSGAVIQNPALGARNKAASDLLKAAAELGMTPSARSRVQAEAPDEDEDPFFD
jgi:P27 family predicted phage terminase small subunit